MFTNIVCFLVIRTVFLSVTLEFCCFLISHVTVLCGRYTTPHITTIENSRLPKDQYFSSCLDAYKTLQLFQCHCKVFYGCEGFKFISKSFSKLANSSRRSCLSNLHMNCFTCSLSTLRNRTENIISFVKKSLSSA